jgi:hypothetical protein
MAFQPDCLWLERVKSARLAVWPSLSRHRVRDGLKFALSPGLED